MRRSTVLYLVTLPVLALGIWLVIQVGTRLSAPRDLSGVWQIESANPVLATSGGPSKTLKIQQSGRYLSAWFDNGPALDLRLIKQANDPRGGFTNEIAGKNWGLTLDVTGDRDSVHGTFSGDRSGHFTAHTTPDDRNAAAAKAARAASAGSHTLMRRLLDSPIALILVQVTLVLMVSRLMGILFARLHQPQVVGEMIAGIMLGPSLFGLLFPATFAAVFPKDPAAMAGVNILAQVGVIFFMFLIGLELDPKLIRNRGHAAVVISHVSIIAPFLLGASLTLLLYPRVFNQQMPYTSVALFMGASMSITAFPVLARILTERNLHKTAIGAVTITCAAVDDVTAWCMLAFVVAVARSTGTGPATLTAVKAVAYVIVMFFAVRPFLRRLQAVHDRQGTLSQNVVATIFLLTLVSAYTTEAIGIHALFGAFLMGAVMPKGTQFVRTLSAKLEDYTVVFLLPLFFAFTGLRTQIGLLNSGPLWMCTLLIIFVACLGKFGGSTLAARACGMSWRESSAIGILMNTRGLMELVILNIGLELGVITPAVFAMMVIMALVTTGLTTPVLQLITTRKLFGDGIPELRPKRRGLFSILIPVADPRSGGPLLRLADLLAGKDGRIVALHLSRPVDRDAYRSGFAEASQPVADTLRPMLEQAAQMNTTVEPLSYVSQDVPDAISRVARESQIDLVLMGFHKAVVGRAMLGGTVHRVLSGTPRDVAVFVDRDYKGGPRVLVPYLGGRHDRLALDLASRLARNGPSTAEITVLHVVPPRRREGRQLDTQGAVDRAFNDPTQPAPVHVRVVENASPVDAVLQAAKDFDLVVIGVSEEWGLASHLFGWRPERIVDAVPVSMLIVRKFARSDREADPEPTPSEPAEPATQRPAVEQSSASA